MELVESPFLEVIVTLRDTRFSVHGGEGLTGLDDLCGLF